MTAAADDADVDHAAGKERDKTHSLDSRRRLLTGQVVVCRKECASQICTPQRACNPPNGVAGARAVEPVGSATA